MHDFIHFVTNPWLLLCATLALLAVGSTSSRRPSTWRHRDLADDFDESYPLQSTLVRHGVVAERTEQMLPSYVPGMTRDPNPPRVLHYLYTIICHDVAGNETLEIVVAKDSKNEHAGIGRTVQVHSQACRFNHRQMLHTVFAV